MKAKHHFWTSLVAGSLLSLVTKSSQPLWGAMIGGFLIDADHIIDQFWSILQGAPHTSNLSAQEAKQDGWRGFARSTSIRRAACPR